MAVVRQVDWTKKTLPIFAADGVRARKIPQILACRFSGGQK